MTVILEILILTNYVLNISKGCSHNKKIDCLTNNKVETLKINPIT